MVRVQGDPPTRQGRFIGQYLLNAEHQNKGLSHWSEVYAVLTDGKNIEAGSSKKVKIP